MRVIQLIIAFSILASCSKVDFDIVIINGTIVDGSGDESYKGDIGIINDRIVKIGDLSLLSSRRTIDANNLIVSPGFIDSHTHAIRGIFNVPTAESSLLQGITTLTEGNDGTSPFPIDEHYQKIENTKITPNWAVFVGQGTIRQEVMGLENRDPTAAELSKMKTPDSRGYGRWCIRYFYWSLLRAWKLLFNCNEVIELSKVASQLWWYLYLSYEGRGNRCLEINK